MAAVCLCMKRHEYAKSARRSSEGRSTASSPSRRRGTRSASAGLQAARQPLAGEEIGASRRSAASPIVKVARVLLFAAPDHAPHCSAASLGVNAARVLLFAAPQRRVPESVRRPPRARLSSVISSTNNDIACLRNRSLTCGHCRLPLVREGGTLIVNERQVSGRGESLRAPDGGLRPRHHVHTEVA